jgi:hypothetical protein
MLPLDLSLHYPVPLDRPTIFHGKRA